MKKKKKKKKLSIRGFWVSCARITFAARDRHGFTKRPNKLDSVTPQTSILSKKSIATPPDTYIQGYLA